MKRKTLETIVTAILVVLLLAVMYATSWAIVCGLLKLITMCLDLPFSLSVATGIWLIICLIKFIFGRGRSEKNG